MIETVNDNNLDELLPLIREYQQFYKVGDICEENNKCFFSRFGEDSADGCQFLYREQEQIVGFATVYFSFSSTLCARVAVLNDVYTRPEYRGKGIARQLIEHCDHYAKARGAARLQWLTAVDNTQAQALYDDMSTRKSSWYFYSLDA